MGVALGLTIAWVIAPVQYINADAADLRLTYKEDYLRLISATYQVDNDLRAAREQIAQLGFANSAQAFNNLITRENQAGRAATLAALAHLAQDLDLRVPALALITPTPESDAPHSAVTATPTPSAFRIAEKIALTCTDEPNDAQLKFFVRDAQGRDLPNIAIEIRWANGEEIIVTGLKPEQGLGYADFDAAPGNYSAKIQNAASENATDLLIGAAPANCKTDKGATPRGWKIIFRQK